MAYGLAYFGYFSVCDNFSYFYIWRLMNREEMFIEAMLILFKDEDGGNKELIQDLFGFIIHRGYKDNDRANMLLKYLILDYEIKSVTERRAELESKLDIKGEANEQQKAR